MTRHRLSTKSFKLENLIVEHLIHTDDVAYWTVVDNKKNILYRHQDRGLAITFANQHLKMLKAEKQFKELTNA